VSLFEKTLTLRDPGVEILFSNAWLLVSSKTVPFHSPVIVVMEAYRTVTAMGRIKHRSAVRSGACLTRILPIRSLVLFRKASRVDLSAMSNNIRWEVSGSRGSLKYVQRSVLTPHIASVLLVKSSKMTLGAYT